MKLYVDKNGCIMAVNSTERTDLTEIYVDDTLDDFAFKGWSETRICCYRVEVTDGVITMFTPYVPTHMISALENLEKQNTELRATQEENDADLLYQICLLQLGITEDELI